VIDLMAQLKDALGDAYRIEHELRRGGMSRLYLATERANDRRVVVKLLPPDLADDVTVTRFRREIEMVSMLVHPNILPIIASGTRGAIMYYIMPYVPGETLRHRLERENPLQVDDAVRILHELGGALDLAHAHGVVHRDIKPENVLLPDGHAVLTDFGVALALAHRRPSGRLTGAGTGVGTPGYMSPEQALGEREVDASSDVYGLAIVGYEMLAGKAPFTGPTLQAVLAAHVRDIPPPLSTIRPEVPKTVSDAIAKALAKDPAKRYPTAGAFREALGGVSARGGTGVAGPRRRQAIAAATAVAAVALAIAAWIFLRGRAAP